MDRIGDNMKNLIAVLAILLIVPVAYADRWCEWSGTEGENCVNDNSGVLLSPTKVPTRTEWKINTWGLFRVAITQPTVEEDELRDVEVWDKVDNQISLTWTVRDMTAIELDNRASSPMPLSEYYLWKALLATGVITQQQAATYLPQELIDAYQARDRLENP
jgi:hypothetical protein